MLERQRSLHEWQYVLVVDMGEAPPEVWGPFPDYEVAYEYIETFDPAPDDERIHIAPLTRPERFVSETE